MDKKQQDAQKGRSTDSDESSQQTARGIPQPPQDHKAKSRIGADDVDPFNPHSKESHTNARVKGMFASPEDIFGMGQSKNSKNQKDKPPKRPPYADFDPTDPFGHGADPDSDDERFTR
ncbi:hypothetical protein PAPHI01_0301 [Pancytospora philotis]|nr:hypothetical protein PAPHI01_0301 [Pancytospora philotis]